MVYCNMNIFLNIEFIGGLIIPNTLVLCDNGNKKEEVRLLTPYLKKNCIIMAHDYHWGGHEIEWNDVKDLGLDKYEYDLMKSAGWLSLKTNS